MDMIFITNTLATQARTILGWGIAHRQERELHIHV